LLSAKFLRYRVALRALFVGLLLRLVLPNDGHKKAPIRI